MVESIYFLKPAWCGAHRAGLWPEQDFQSVTVATAFRGRFHYLHLGGCRGISVAMDRIADVTTMTGSFPGRGETPGIRAERMAEGEALWFAGNRKPSGIFRRVAPLRGGKMVQPCGCH